MRTRAIANCQHLGKIVGTNGPYVIIGQDDRDYRGKYRKVTRDFILLKKQHQLILEKINNQNQKKNE